MPPYHARHTGISNAKNCYRQFVALSQISLGCCKRIKSLEVSFRKGVGFPIPKYMNVSESKCRQRGLSSAVLLFLLALKLVHIRLTSRTKLGRLNYPLDLFNP